MTLLLTNKDVERATDIKAQIDSIEQGLHEEARNAVDLPPRLNLATTSGFFRVMPAVMRDSGLMGYKVFHGSVQHGVRYLIAVYDEKDGRLLSLMDAAYLTADAHRRNDRRGHQVYGPTRGQDRGRDWLRPGSDDKLAGRMRRPSD